MVIVIVIVRRILQKILTITNNHYLGSLKSPAVRLWGNDGSFAHSSAFHESSPFRKVSQLGFSSFRKCISFATILHDEFFVVLQGLIISSNSPNMQFHLIFTLKTVQSNAAWLSDPATYQNWFHWYFQKEYGPGMTLDFSALNPNHPSRQCWVSHVA